MSSGERPIGAAKGTQSDTEALCQTPPSPYKSNPLLRAAGGVVSTTFGAMSYFALYKSPPAPLCQSNSWCCFRQNFKLLGLWCFSCKWRR